MTPDEGTEPGADGSAAPEYRFVTDDAYFQQALDAWRRQHAARPWFLAVKVVCALGLVLLIAVSAWGMTHAEVGRGPLAAITLVMAGVLGLLASGPRADDFLLKRRWRGSPFHGAATRLVLGEDGVVQSSDRSASTLSWSVFTRWTRLPHGHLLFMGPSAWWWCPTSALVSGTPDDVDRLLAARIPASSSPGRRGRPTSGDVS